MQHVRDHFFDPADHLACDESLLLAADDGESGESIRIWQFDRPTVVLGRSSRVDDEVNRSLCDQQGIPIYRRCSGGASVVGGPGCLMYSIVLSFEQTPQLHKIDVAHRYVMTKVLASVRRQVPEVMLQGICDLTWRNRKCSGNSLRIARRHLLYHGTILHDFDLGMVGRCLAHTPRQPDYRDGRDHDSFVTNVPLDTAVFSMDLCHAFGVTDEADAGRDTERIMQLRQQRYDLASWHFRH